MSGIETIIGLAASGAGLLSLGIQLGESAAKLNRIYHAAKDAPKTIARLAHSLETMAIALQQLEQHRQQSSQDGTLLARCITQCQQGTADIQQLVNRMEAHLAKHARFTGRMYAVFKERDIKELLDDLEKAKSSLELSYMVFIAEEQRRRDQEYYRRLAHHENLLQDLQAQVSSGNAGISQQLTLLDQSLVSQQGILAVTSSTRTTFASNSTLRTSDRFAVAKGSNSLELASLNNSSLHFRRLRRKNSQTVFRATLGLPPWLSRRIWDLAITSAQCRWTMHLRTYNIVPNNSLVFHHCYHGNLSRMRKRIESGKATPLDVQDHGQGWLTLLEAAANYGRLDICRYLLGKTTWPDHATVLNRALNRFAYLCEAGAPGEFYRIFMDNPGFDGDLETSCRYPWLHYCRDRESLDVVLQREFSGFECCPAEMRFEMASRLSCSELPNFLRCIGLQPSHPKLTNLRNSGGTSVLHCVARHLSAFAWRNHSPAKAQEWLDLGVSIIENGADPYSISNENNDTGIPANLSYNWELSQTTPLIDCVNISLWQMNGEFEAWLSQILRNLHVWANMLNLAGIDLCEYGAKENEAWKTIGLVESRSLSYVPIVGSQALKVRQLVYGPTPTDWSLETYYLQTCPSYLLISAPGHFPEEIRLPATIGWMPTRREENEGAWRLVRTKCLISRDLDLRVSLTRLRGPYNELVDGTQDDSSVIMLMQDRASRRLRVTSRSHSQPPCLRRREIAYYAKRGSRKHEWFPPYHLCPLDNRWKIGCIGGSWLMPHENEESYDSYQRLHDNNEWHVFHVRSCAEGIQSGRFSAQESRAWQKYSFLADITYLQDSYQDYKEVCVDQLNVPERLRPYHPRRKFPDEDE